MTAAEQRNPPKTRSLQEMLDAGILSFRYDGEKWVAWEEDQVEVSPLAPHINRNEAA